MSPTFDVVELATTYANKSAQDILKLAFAEFGDDLWISFSGAEDVVLVDMAWKLNKNVKVFSLDTGRLHPETYRFIDQVREHYKIDIELVSPDYTKLEPFVKEKACSASTRTAMANAAASARSSRCAASCLA
jgi:phosphoadenosine phosphosulfate reductase